MGNNRKSISLKERSSVPISKLTKGADQGWAPMKSTKKGRAPMKPIKKGLASGNRGRAPAPLQILLQGRLNASNSQVPFGWYVEYITAVVSALTFVAF
jgi:hypothetical protein